MVVEYIRYSVPESERAAFEAAYGEAAHSLDASPHCISYELSRGVEEPGHYILRIEWDSIEGHENGFRREPEFGPFFEAIRPYFDEIEEMKHYDPTAVGSRSGTRSD